MALNQTQLSQAQNWLNSNWGGGYGADGTYQPGAYQYNPNNSNMNWDILGAAQANGFSPADVSQVLGTYGANVSAQDIGNYAHNNAPQVGMGAELYLSGNGYPAGGGAPAGGGSQSSTPGDWFSSAPSYQGGGYGDYTQNPYLTQQADDIGRRTQEMLGQAFAGIRGQNVGNGTLGGSRGEIAMGLAGGRAADYLQGTLANLYGQDYNNSQNRGLQRYQGDQNAFLGNQGQMLGFYNAQRGLDQSGAALGGSLYNLAGQQDWFGLNNGSNIFNQTAGNGTTTQNNSSQTGGGWQGALGGALGAGQFARNAGWW